jgi:hypothetical protein
MTTEAEVREAFESKIAEYAKREKSLRALGLHRQANMAGRIHDRAVIELFEWSITAVDA